MDPVNLNPTLHPTVDVIFGDSFGSGSGSGFGSGSGSGSGSGFANCPVVEVAEALCEGNNFGEDECLLLSPCCEFDDGTCSANGDIVSAFAEYCPTVEAAEALCEGKNFGEE